MHTNHILRLSNSPSLPYWTALVLNWQNCHRPLCPSTCCSVVFYQLRPPASLLLIRLIVATRSPCCSNQASSVPVHSLTARVFNAVIQLFQLAPLDGHPGFGYSRLSLTMSFAHALPGSRLTVAVWCLCVSAVSVSASCVCFPAGF